MARFNSAAFHRYRGAPVFRPQQATRGYRGILGRRTLGNPRSSVLFCRNMCPKRVLDLHPLLYDRRGAYPMPHSCLCPQVLVLIGTSQVLYLEYIQYTPETCDPAHF